MQELEKLLRLALLEAAGMSEEDAQRFMLALAFALEDFAFERDIRYAAVLVFKTLRQS